jgi:protein TonB
MSVHAGLISDLVGPRFHKREVALWSGAAVLVVAAHVGSAWLIHQSSPLPPPPDEAPPAIMLDLAPMVVAPDAVPMDIAETVDSAMTEQVEEPVETAEQVTEEMDPVEETEVAEAVPEEVQEVAPDTMETEQAPEVVPEETITEAEEVVPDLIEVPLPEVAMAIPEPRPEIEEPKPVVRKKAEKKPAKEKPVEKEPAEKTTKKRTPPKASAPSVRSAENSSRAAAPAARQGSSGSSMSPANWVAKVNARMARGKRYIKAKGEGTVWVRFTVGDGGDVQSVSVTRSSGDPELDKSAAAMVQRISPLPAPPPGVNRRLSIPIVVEPSGRKRRR